MTRLDIVERERIELALARDARAWPRWKRALWRRLFNDTVRAILWRLPPYDTRPDPEAPRG